MHFNFLSNPVGYSLHTKNKQASRQEPLFNVLAWCKPIGEDTQGSLGGWSPFHVLYLPLHGIPFNSLLRYYSRLTDWVRGAKNRYSVFIGSKHYL